MKSTLSLFVALSCCLGQSRAQNAIVPVPLDSIPTPLSNVPEKVSQKTPTWHTLDLKNVPASLMASWLSAPVKVISTTVLETGESIQLKRLMKRPPVSDRLVQPTAPSFVLPAGVETVFPVNSKSELMVLGTDEGVKQLQETVAFLDCPQPQVSMESQFVRVDGDSLEKLSDTPTEQVGPYTVAKARSGYRPNVLALVSQRKAEFLSKVRVVKSDPYLSIFMTGTPTAVQINPNLDLHAFGGLQIPQANFSLVPLFRNSQSILVQLATNHSKFIKPLSSSSLQGGTVGRVSRSFSVKDGETILIEGFDPDLYFHGPEALTANVVLLVTFRVTRDAAK